MIHELVYQITRYIKTEYKDYSEGYLFTDVKVGISKDIFIKSNYKAYIAYKTEDIIELKLKDKYQVIIGIDTSEIEVESVDQELMDIQEVRRNMPLTIAIMLEDRNKSWVDFLKKSNEYPQELDDIIKGQPSKLGTKRWLDFFSRTRLCKQLNGAFEDFLYKKQNSIALKDSILPEIAGYRSFLPFAIIDLDEDAILYWGNPKTGLYDDIRKCPIDFFLENKSIGVGWGRSPSIPKVFGKWVSKSKYLIDYKVFTPRNNDMIK